MKITSTRVPFLFVPKSLQSWVLLTISLLLTGFILITDSALAATFTVNNAADGVDVNPGDGICATVGGFCTLRAAIMEANALAGADTITLPAGVYTLTIAGADEDASTTGDLDIIQDLTINGAGSATTIIDGNNLDRVFDIHNGVVTISGVTIRGGNPGLANGGGGILMYTVLITDNVSLTLANSIVSNNSATFGGGILKLSGSLTISNSTITGNNTSGIGAGIFNNIGTMTLTNVTVSMNIAEGDAGGIENGGSATLNSVTINGNVSSGDGGGIFSGGSATLSLSASKVTNNSAARGGGIFANGTETVTDSTISANLATLQGGGVINFTESIITNSTISGNSTANQGGGIFTGGSLLLTNVTISGNYASIGGGLFSFGSETLTNVTINGNNAADGGGIFNSLETISLRNSIVANNLGGNCTIFSGSITSLGRNLDYGNTCAFAASGDIINTDPLLGPLANNGGPTMTHALLSGSPAINAADPTTFPATDQRGVTRPQGAGPDIGAYELVPSIATAVSVPTMTELGLIIFTVLAGILSVNHLRKNKLTEE